MPRRSLLDEIEAEAIDGDISRALRLCLKLGGQAGSVDLREWANRELNGYPEDLPDYRLLRVPLRIDGSNMAWSVSGQQITKQHLPEPARDAIPDDVEMRHAIPELAAMVRDDSLQMLRFAPPASAHIINLLNYQFRKAGETNAVHSIYWEVSRASVEGVIENVRTRLVELVAEIRAGLEPGEEVPSPELTEQAVNIAIHGRGNRVAVNQGNGSSTAVAGDVAGAEKGRSGRIWVIVGALAGVVMVVIAVVQLWG